MTKRTMTRIIKLKYIYNTYSWFEPQLFEKFKMIWLQTEKQNWVKGLE